MSIAALWAKVPRFDTVHLAADGRSLWFAWEGVHETAEIYSAEIGGPPQRLTFGTDHFAIRDVRADGSAAIVAQSRNANEHDRLFLLGTDGSLTALTPEQHTHYLYGGRFLPGTDDIIFTADFDYETGDVTRGGQLWRQSLKTGARTRLIRTDGYFEDGPAPSPDGTRLMFSRHDRAPGGDQLWLIGADGHDPREVLAFGDRSPIRAHWLDDDRIAFVTDDRLGVLTLATGAVEWLPCLNPQDIVMGHGEFAVLAYTDSRLEPMLFPGNRPFPNPSKRRSVLPIAAFPNGDWLVEAYDADAPAELWRVSNTGGTVLVTAPPSPDRQHISPRDWRWTSRDGTHIQGWLYQPDGASKGLVVSVHGGPTWHSEDWINPRIGALVQAGYTVLDPNYRGSTGFGMRFREAIKKDGWGGAEQDDIRAGIESLLDAGLAQRGKIAVIGISYGGYSSWFAITRMSDLVTAAVPICGMYRLDLDYGATEMPHGRAYSEEMMGGTPDDMAAKYRAASPSNFISNIKGAVLIVHGLSDSNVAPENTRAAMRELTEAGIAHEVLLFDNEGHGINRQSNQEVLLDRIINFLERAFG